MLESLFNLPLLVSGPGLILLLCLFALGGLTFVRRRVLPRLQVRLEDSEFIGAMLQAIMVFYGLALALIAVTVWQTYSEVSRIISEEATAIGSLYRDVSAYPDPPRSQLQRELCAYLDYLIHQAWPRQAHGDVHPGGVEMMNQFQAVLTGFEPTTDGQKLLHAETLHAYNLLTEARRLRLDSVRICLPNVLWLVVFAGAFISLSATFFFQVKDPRLHAILVMLLAILISLVIFMTFALDRPFRGDLGLRPDSYQLLLDQLPAMPGGNPR